MTVKDFINRLWYRHTVIVINENNYDPVREIGFFALLEKRSIYTGEAYKLCSSEYTDVNSKNIKSYGIIDGAIIILVY